MYAYSVLVIPLEQEFQATRMAMMWGITLSAPTSAVSSLWLGPLADRGSIRAMMAVGAVSLAVGLSVLSFASAAWHVALCYALFMGCAQVLLGPLTASTLVARWFSSRRGLALGVLALGASFGGLLIPPLLQYLIAELDWRVACRVLAAVILMVTLPPVWLLIVNTPANKRLARMADHLGRRGRGHRCALPAVDGGGNSAPHGFLARRGGSGSPFLPPTSRC